MIVQELIDSLSKIDDKAIEIVFLCPVCQKFIEVEDMAEFGFKVNHTLCEHA